MNVADADFQQHFALERELERELVANHAGQWVGIREHRVIAVADSAHCLHEQLADQEQSYRSFRVSPRDGVAFI
jgi:hypothetical protein